MLLKGEKGVTLIEVMVVVVILGILAAVAIPAYDNYVTRSRRSDAFTAMETVRAAQEMYRAERGFYAVSFTGNVLPGCSATMGGDNYTISIAGAATTFTVTATPKNRQAGDFTFTVNQNGAKTYNGTSVNSWEDLPRN